MRLEVVTLHVVAWTIVHDMFSVERSFTAAKVSSIDSAVSGYWPLLRSELVAQKVAFIAGFGDVIGQKLRKALQFTIGGRHWTDGIDSGHIL
jgi:outer membrane protein assembly factor BamA